jgi:hypothetical protein
MSDFNADDERPVRERLRSLETRMGSAELWMDDFRLKWADAVREIRQNTALTEEIHGDTKDIVEAVKWISTAKRLCISIVLGVAGVTGAIVGTLKALKMLGLMQ